MLLKMRIRPANSPGIYSARHLRGEHVREIFSSAVEKLLLISIGGEIFVVGNAPICFLPTALPCAPSQGTAAVGTKGIKGVVLRSADSEIKTTDGKNLRFVRKAVECLIHESQEIGCRQ